MKAKRITALLAAAALTASCFAGCGKTDDSSAKGTEAGTEAEKTDDLSEHVELSIGGLVLSDSSSDVWPNDVAKTIEDKFNVTLTIKEYDKESLNLDLSGGNTCDIVQISDDNIEGVLKGKHAVNLSNYESIAPNIFSEQMEFRNGMMQNSKSDEDGGLYFVTTHVGSEDAAISYNKTVNYGYVVRWDLYKAIGCPEINNDDDYIEALKAMKEIYPQTEDGLETYAMSAYNDSNLHTYFFKGCLAEGYVNLEEGLYVQDVETNDLVADVYDEGSDVKTPFWSGVEFYNKLYKAGLLDPDNFITTGEDLTEKYTKGQYLGGTVGWHYGTYNTNNAGTDKEYLILPAKMGWMNEINRTGWTGKYLYVSSHSKNVERAVMVLDYLQSGEFARDLFSGVEGRWEVGEDGTPALTEDTISMKTDSDRTDEWEQSGINNSNLENIVGWDNNNLLEDGGRADLWNNEDVLAQSLTVAQKELCEYYDITLPSDLLKNRIEAGTSIDQRKSEGALRSCLETTPKDIVRIDSNCVEITINALPSLIQAETDEEFAAAKAALLQQLKDAGVEDSVEWWMAAWETSEKTLEELLK